MVIDFSMKMGSCEKETWEAQSLKPSLLMSGIGYSRTVENKETWEAQSMKPPTPFIWEYFKG